MVVEVEKEGPVTTVCFHRPNRKNAVDRATAEALVEAFEAFEADAEARVAILYGRGGTFCAGADLHAIAEGRPNRIAVDGHGPMGPTRMHLRKPVIAAIEGYAVAGGLELALWCDLRVASNEAILGVFCRRWGVPLIDGGTIRLPRLIGLSQALDLILTGREVRAEEALSMGLLNRVCERGTALDEALRLARNIAEHPQACMLADRDAAYRQVGLDLDAALALEFNGAQSVLENSAMVGATRYVAMRQGRAPLNESEEKKT